MNMPCTQYVIFIMIQNRTTVWIFQHVIPHQKFSGNVHLSEDLNNKCQISLTNMSQINTSITHPYCTRTILTTSPLKKVWYIAEPVEVDGVVRYEKTYVHLRRFVSVQVEEEGRYFFDSNVPQEEEEHMHNGDGIDAFISDGKGPGILQ